MDVAFLLDSSYNMRQDNFAAAKGFISTMIDRLTVSSTGDRVALVSNTPPNFRPSNEASPHVEFDLSTYDNNILLKKHLLNVNHLQGPPALGFTLQWTIKNIMSKASNARKHKAIIIILSGETSEWDKQTLAQASLNAKCEGYPIFVLFTGKTYNDTELMDLPSIPVDHHLLQLGRIHKPEFGYALGFTHSFLNSIRRKYFCKETNKKNIKCLLHCTYSNCIFISLYKSISKGKTLDCRFCLLSVSYWEDFSSLPALRQNMKLEDSSSK